MKTAIRSLRAGLTACLFLIANLPGVSAAPLDSIDTAGRQRMLSQRLVKLAAQQALMVAPEQSARLLSESAETFDRQLKQLAAAPADALNRQQLFAVSSQWRTFKPLLQTPPQRESIQLINAQAEQLLRLAETLTTGLEQSNRSSRARLVNLSGRQRMLSQRMAKTYMLKAWLGDSSELRSELATAMQAFEAAHAQLLSAPESTADIRHELEAIGVQWEWFKQALALDGAFAYTLVVADASEGMLAGLERVVSLYARQ